MNEIVVESAFYIADLCTLRVGVESDLSRAEFQPVRYVLNVVKPDSHSSKHEHDQNESDDKGKLPHQSARLNVFHSLCPFDH